MPNLPISQLPEITTGLTANAEFAVSQGGTTYKVKSGYLSSGNLYGVFIDTADQPLAENVATVWTANTTLESYGVQLNNNSEFTVLSAGTYNFQFSAQANADGNNERAFIWFRLNGDNIPDSATQYSFADNNYFAVLAWNFVITMAAGDYLEFVWASSTGDAITMQAIPSQSSPVIIPSVPSLIVTVTQV